MKKYVIYPLILGALGACNSNPYPNEGSLSDRPERDRRPVLSVLSIAVDSTLSFSEGSEGSYPVILNVPSGDPVFEIEGLPEGANFDQEKSEIRWTPGFTDANDPSNPTTKSKDYLVGLHLRSSRDPNSSVSRKVTLRVSDTPRAFSVTGIASNYNLGEGEVKDLAKFRLRTEDFPNGPFSVSLSNDHRHLQLVKGADLGEWILRAGPFPFDSVKAPSSATQTLHEKIVAFAPDGRRAEVAFSVRLSDMRKAPVMALPMSLTTTGELRMTFSAFDPNLEVAPTVSVSRAPAVGDFSITEIASAKGILMERQFALAWTSIPPEATGRTYDALLQVCNSSLGSINHFNCRMESISLNVAPREVALPEISRTAWKPDEMRYLLLNQKHAVRLGVKPGGTSSILNIRATGSDSTDDVEYRSSTLEIIPRRPGLKVINLQATNSLGGTSFASFLYEALPENWSSNLILGLPGEDPELAGLEAMLKTSNRDYHGSERRGPRSLAHRSQLLVGTHSLLRPDAREEVAFFSHNLKTVIVTSPRLDLLPASLIAELQDNSVYLAGRSSQLPDFKLEEFLLTVGRGMGNPSGISGLGGKTTAESGDPAFLTVTGASECAKLFYLLKPGPMPQEYTLGVSCRRAGGGRLVVLGFEWADMLLSQPDSGLPSVWFKRMMEL